MTDAIFDIAVEVTPPWVHLASAAVIVVCALAAAGAVPLWAIVPFLALTSMRARLPRRSGSLRAEVRGDTLAIGAREIPRSSVIDVWVDDERDEPRIVVAFGENIDVVTLRFDTAIEARRFRDALAPEDENAGRIVCGARPRLVDALSSLRLLAVAGAFFAVGSRVGLLVLVFVALGAWSLLRTRQVIASRSDFTIRAPFSAKTYRYDDVKEVDVSEAIIRLADGTEIELPSRVLRDGAMTSPPWLSRARSRMLEAIQRGTLMALPGSTPS